MKTGEYVSGKRAEKDQGLNSAQHLDEIPLMSQEVAGSYLKRLAYIVMQQLYDKSVPIQT